MRLTAIQGLAVNNETARLYCSKIWGYINRNDIGRFVGVNAALVI